MLLCPSELLVLVSVAHGLAIVSTLLLLVVHPIVLPSDVTCARVQMNLILPFLFPCPCCALVRLSTNDVLLHRHQAAPSLLFVDLRIRQASC